MQVRKGKKISLACLVFLIQMICFMPMNSIAGPIDKWTVIENQGLSQGSGVLLNNWTEVTNSLSGMAYGKNTVVAVGTAGKILTSSDLAIFTARDSGTVNDLYGVAFGNNMFVAVGANGTMLTSSDGITWSPMSWTQQSPQPSETLYGIVYGNSMFVVVGTNGAILTSSNGTTWSTAAPVTAGTLYDVAFGNGSFVAVGPAGTILHSSNGTAWSVITPVTAETLYDASFGNGKFIAVGSIGTMLSSSNGTSWSASPTVTYSGLYGVSYGNKTFLAVGDNGTILSSADYGATWGPQTANRSNAFMDTLFLTMPTNISYFLIAGQEYIILRSDPISALIFPDKSTLSFGSVQLNAESAQTVTLTNNGNADLVISSVTKNGTNADQFVVTNTCVGAAVAPSQNCTVQVVFKPTSIGAKSANVTVQTNASNIVSLVISLAGTGFAPPAISVTPPASSDFGSVGVGSSSTVKSFTVSNTGVGDLVITAAAMTADDYKSFAVDKGTCTSLTPVIVPGGSCTLRTVFSPTAEGAKTTSLQITSNDPDPVKANYAFTLNGTGALLQLADIPIDHWARDCVYAMYNNNVIQECGSGAFCPDMNVTRADMAIFMMKARGDAPEASCTGKFSDVNAATVGDELCRYIEKFSTLGITAGCVADNPGTPGINEAQYCPNEKLTRAQMAVFFSKALNAAPTACSGIVFNDVNSGMSGGNSFCGYIEQFKNLNITSGCVADDPGTPGVNEAQYCPADNLTRAQMAVFLTKAFDILYVPRSVLVISKGGAGSGTISSVLSGGGAGVNSTPHNCSQSSCQEAYDPNALVTLTATPDASSVFTGWSGACSGNTNPYTVSMNKSKSCAADFALKTYTVTPSAGTGGSISPNTAQSVEHGKTRSFTVSPNGGYTATVGGTCGGSPSSGSTQFTYTTNAITANCTVTASFTTNPVNGQCGSSNGGTFASAPTTGLCNSGTPTAVMGGGTWTWSCQGSNGGTTANCSANVQSTPGGVTYKNVVLSLVAPGYYYGDLMFEQIGPKPAQLFYKVNVPSSCTSLDIGSSGVLSASGYINVNNLYSVTPYNASTALNIYNEMMSYWRSSFKQGNLGRISPIDNNKYWYKFSDDPETEILLLSAPLSSVYYVMIVNETNATGKFNLRVSCY